MRLWHPLKRRRAEREQACQKDCEQEARVKEIERRANAMLDLAHLLEDTPINGNEINTILESHEESYNAQGRERRQKQQRRKSDMES